MEAIILAGGLGTRLRSVVSEVPKCMAPVAGKPFLWYLLTYLARYPEVGRGSVRSPVSSLSRLTMPSRKFRWGQVEVFVWLCRSA